jgi:hypothetical protein
MDLNWENKRGFNFNGRKLFKLRFTDYIVLFTNPNGELQKSVNELTKLSTDSGLQVKE